MRKVFLTLYAILLLTSIARAQSTTVSSTGVVDTDGFTWKNGTVNITFIPAPNSPSFSSYTWSGGTLFPSYSTTLNSSGALSTSLPSSTSINPLGSGKPQFQVCPNATTGCFTYVVFVTGATQDITTALNAVATGPRFPGSATNHAFQPR